jgi:hypothetical protein
MMLPLLMLILALLLVSLSYLDAQWLILVHAILVVFIGITAFVYAYVYR